MTLDPGEPAIAQICHRILDVDTEADRPWRIDAVEALPFRTMVGPSMEWGARMEQRIDAGRHAVLAESEWLLDYMFVKRWVEIRGPFTTPGESLPMYWYFLGNDVPTPHFIMSALEQEGGCLSGGL